MNSIAKKLTNYIYHKGLIEEEYFDVYQYGFECFLEISINFISCIIIGLSLHMLLECLIFFFFFIPLRSYSGGLHMSTYMLCYLLSCLIVIVSLLIVKNVSLPAYVSFLIYLLSAIFLHLIGPVDHPNREVDAEDNQKFMKKAKITILIGGICAIIFLIAHMYPYLLLEALVYMIVLITSFIGKLIYK